MTASACSGKVLVSEDEQIKRLSAARFQLELMEVPGIKRSDRDPDPDPDLARPRRRRH